MNNDFIFEDKTMTKKKALKSVIINFIFNNNYRPMTPENCLGVTG